MGIITRADLVRAYVRSDEELARTIREDVILGILWHDPGTARRRGHGWECAIRGRVQRRSTAEMLERAAAMVPGIISVDAQVSWSVDDDQVQVPTPRSGVPVRGALAAVARRRRRSVDRTFRLVFGDRGLWCSQVRAATLTA